ncbi:hypothetical protein SAMN05421878_11033 [Actinobaculum suis]|uniref:Uncharacterized protein n=1 Tax=Actinobaculum suis TaxID=1657 RepID=A0A1G7D8D7_9ACTO|nr:hypothetical protein [Actinobaculum suis]MDY5153322.1 hypothetical protein [Actinobaculum suis]SDE47801.1 hypothetical protein SAMN05421878_11033 [Actinobaculum suis]
MPRLQDIISATRLRRGKICLIELEEPRDFAVFSGSSPVFSPLPVLLAPIANRGRERIGPQAPLVVEHRKGSVTGQLERQNE